MSNLESIAMAYLETWNESESAARSQKLCMHWDEHARYIDPRVDVQGYEALSTLIQNVQELFPEFRFKLAGRVDGYGPVVRFSWTFGPAAGPAPVEGSDVLLLRDGKITQVIGFIEKAP